MLPGPLLLFTPIPAPPNLAWNFLVPLLGPDLTYRILCAVWPDFTPPPGGTILAILVLAFHHRRPLRRPAAPLRRPRDGAGAAHEMVMIMMGARAFVNPSLRRPLSFMSVSSSSSSWSWSWSSKQPVGQTPRMFQDGSRFPTLHSLNHPPGHIL